MPLRLDNAKGVAHMPTAEQQQQKNKPVEPRFKIDRAASPMPENRQPERLAPGRDQIGMVGEIISESWARSNRYTRARSSESAPEHWDAPINQIDWDARAVRLLIEAVCDVACMPLSFSNLREDK
jgi:hypothetical protein